MSEMTQYTQGQAPAFTPHTGQAPAVVGGTFQAADGASGAVTSIIEWANELDAAAHIANRLAGTDFVPQGLRGNVGATAAAILTGHEIGLKPMAALANIFVVRGRPAMYARTMVSLALSHGHEVERVEATEQTVTVRGRRRGSQAWQTFTWTIDRAKRAGYTANQKYQSDPIGMLTAKAQAECCRTMFPDVLSGMAASAEEIQLGDYTDDTPIQQAQGAPRKAVSRTVRRKSAQAPAVEPKAPHAVHQAPQEPEYDDGAEGADPETGELPEQPEDQGQEEQGEPEYIARADQGKISNLLERLDITDRTEKLQTVRTIIGDDSLRGVNGLTVAQGREVIRELEGEIAQLDQN